MYCTLLWETSENCWDSQSLATLITFITGCWVLNNNNKASHAKKKYAKYDTDWLFQTPPIFNLDFMILIMFMQALTTCSQFFKSLLTHMQTWILKESLVVVIHPPVITAVKMRWETRQTHTQRNTYSMTLTTHWNISNHRLKRQSTTIWGMHSKRPYTLTGEEPQDPERTPALQAVKKKNSKHNIIVIP